MEMHRAAIVQRSWDLLGDVDPLSLEAVIKRVWRCGWRPWSSEIGEVLGGGQLLGGCSGVRRDGSWESIHWLTCNCCNKENWIQHSLPWNQSEDWSRTADFGIIQYAVNAVLGLGCILCMLYLVYADPHVNSSSWHGVMERDDWILSF
jgi:hypothetical protein